MARITQKQLAEQIRMLKDIKPRKEWAVLLKSQILAEKQVELKVPEKQARTMGIMDVFSSLFFQKKLAYAFAAFLFVVVGFLGYSKYVMPGDMLFPAKKIAEQSTAALTGQSGLKQDVAILNSRINDLAQVAKDGRKDNIPSAIDEIKTNVATLAHNLKNNPTEDSQTIKDIANSLKVLADVPGTDLTSNADLESLTQTVVQSQITDLKKTTLTDEQNKTLATAEDLYNQGKYTDALEMILLISK